MPVSKEYTIGNDIEQKTKKLPVLSFLHGLLIFALIVGLLIWANIQVWTSIF